MGEFDDGPTQAGLFQKSLQTVLQLEFLEQPHCDIVFVFVLGLDQLRRAMGSENYPGTNGKYVEEKAKGPGLLGVRGPPRVTLNKASIGQNFAWGCVTRPNRGHARVNSGYSKWPSK